MSAANDRRVSRTVVSPARSARVAGPAQARPLDAGVGAGVGRVGVGGPGGVRRVHRTSPCVCAVDVDRRRTFRLFFFTVKNMSFLISLAVYMCTSKQRSCLRVFHFQKRVACFPSPFALILAVPF